MLVVHALHSPGRGVLLWAEDGERPARSDRRSLRTARPHPFAVPADELAAVHPGKPASVTLLLPSHGSGPQDSPGLVRERPRAAARSAPALAPWTVPAVLVAPSELTDPYPDVRYGEGFTHLAELVRFADELASRGRVLPVVVSEAGRPAARWRPVVQGLDAVARTGLVRRLPPVARAEQRRPGDVAGRAPDEVVDAALARFTDAAVRERLGRAAGMPVPLPARPDAAAELLHALTGPSPEIPVTGDGLSALREALTAWDDVGREQPGAGTALFRLTEVSSMHDPADPGPDPLDQTGDGTRWELRFALQSTEDPSLQLEAGEVWSGGADQLVDGAQDVLLAELGRAAQVLPDLVRALRDARPTALPLDVAGAHRFLTRDAAALLAAGFGVALPRGWDGQRALGLKLSASSAPAPGAVTRGGLGRDELAHFRWSLAVGDDELGEDEIAALVAAKAPLVRLRGRWVAVDADALARGLDFLRRSRDRTPTVPDVLAAARGDVDAPLPVTDVAARGRLGALLDGTADRELEPLGAPPGFTATLRPYQERGVAWLAFLSTLGLGACLADDMGLGKTVQLLALEAHDRAAGATAPTLIVCPMSMVGTWQREAGRFAPDLRVHAHHGPSRPRGDALHEILDGVDLVVTTYATATRDAEDLRSWRFHRLVLDEAQMIKNSHAAASRTARSLDAAHRIALTGTPMENRLAELWSVMDFLNPGILGSPEVFRQRFAVPVERHGDAGAARTLRRITRPYLLRRVKTDPLVIDDLPEKIEIVQDHRLTREQASLYRTVVDDMMEKIEGSNGIERRGNVLAAMSKLKQVCNHPAQLLHDGSPIHRAGGAHRSGKVARLEEILESVLAAGDKVLLFTQYTEFAAILRPHLSARFDTEVLYLHGGTPKKRRDEMVARFQGDGGPSVFLLSLKAGGTGLTLTAANHVIHLDRWWNPAVEDQATDRAFRIGQKRSVQVRKFVCPGTVEERIDTLVASKRSLSDLVVTDGEDWLTSLSVTELREVFALGSDAVADDAGENDE
ncbi:Helicase, SNF2/RAD54 family [Pseudonocardia sp. Ae168_Ps1]|uniref:DEAD/DEAH box helicase n=1 Tax=unclassified Pseudonocardia TaxID=2619320 RepID=UPI00094B2706|nr:MULTISPECIES: DEAD/DEAH box helicase [unclassified Pseudonocardia]OLL72651.1 Helicase, SNF2/RAD54 family [Pseudonocardia sp. Ae150A_Ps1]OLL78623.1 Helicase, SNF2/RAD54 family [Pseudonocardia sp. Ae168_Ps1]OLL87249.1 Helicase, SNF2/RAD54 family [Pseudonocardia sp. Ae263_Ps1]OLL92721.1 Helicase, SNF2/RAD54 family [Pseudonocardia sp. Ae356_Ps1]